MLNLIEITIMTNVYVTYLIPFDVETVISSRDERRLPRIYGSGRCDGMRKNTSAAVYAYIHIYVSTRAYICKYACIYLRIVVHRLAHLPSRREGGVCIGLVPRRVRKAKLITPSSDVTGLRPILREKEKGRERDDERKRERERVQSASDTILSDFIADLQLPENSRAALAFEGVSGLAAVIGHKSDV